MTTSKTVSGAEMESGYASRPDHKLLVKPADGAFFVIAGEMALAQNVKALVLEEGSYPPAFYFPREAVDMTLLRRTGHSTWCPFKGRASYFSIGDDPALENAVWSYEDPFLEIAEIKDHLAFYADKVAIKEKG